MTRKDYELAAKRLKELDDKGAILHYGNTCTAFADIFRLDNPRFDYRRFYVACDLNVNSAGMSRNEPAK